MTCIIGIEQDGKVYIGGDSAGVKWLDYVIRADEKVFKSGKMIFGFTDSFRMGQILRYSFKIPKHHEDKSDYEYMCTDFIGAVIKVFKDNEYATIKDSAVLGGCFLVGYNGAIYSVEGDFQAGRASRGYHAIGRGESHALGAISAMDDKLKPKDKIKKALEIVGSLSAGVKSPFHIVSV